MIQNIVSINGVETLYIGDMRSYALYRQCVVSKAWHILGDGVSKHDLRRVMKDMEEGETELLVDPAFFTNLANEPPDRVHHVEILPKKIQATNELSCYRYAAVIHLNTANQQPVNKITDDHWIDFATNGLDRRSLSSILQQPSRQSVVPVFNIRNSKNTFNQGVLDALQHDEENKHPQPWFVTTGKEAQSLPSLSAVDLVEIAASAGYQVEINWAQQHSQNGGLDAVFHKQCPAHGGGRVLFNFPTEQAATRFTKRTLSNHPLQHQRERAARDQLHNTLNVSLPSYMVLQTIIFLQKLPLTASGKVDRRELASRRLTPIASSRTESQSPTTAIEKQMQIIWSHVLNIEPDTIGLDHNFFHLGGTPVTAMHVVGEARKISLELTVAEIFRRDSLESLADMKPTAFIQTASQGHPQGSLVEPALQASLLDKIGNSLPDLNATRLVNIYPVTSAQEEHIIHGISSGQVSNYFYIDLEKNISLTKLRQGYLQTVKRYPILGARFLYLKGVYEQAHFDENIGILSVQNAITDLDGAFNDYCHDDMKRLKPGEPPASFVLLTHRSQGSRLIVRLSHAQYDGVCMPNIFKSIFDQETLFDQRIIPQFSDLLSYAKQRRPHSISYWSNLPQGSHFHSILPHISPKAKITNAETKSILLRGAAALTALPPKITAATLVKTAWAVLLASISGQNDIVFGNVVTGQNSAIQGIEALIGPCLNIVPIRAKMSSSQTAAELPASVQEQFVEMGDADILGFRDIIKHCTDWPKESNFNPLLLHQNIEEHAGVDTTSGISHIQYFENLNAVPPALTIKSDQQDDRLGISLIGSTKILTQQTTQGIIDDLFYIIGKLITAKDAPLKNSALNLKSTSNEV